MEQYKRFQNEFHDICQKKGKEIAITYYLKKGGVLECSFYEMESRVMALAERYKQFGLQRGDRVAVLIPLCTNAYLDILSLAYMGVTSVVLDINMNKQEMRRVLKDADVSCVVTTSEIFNDKLKDCGIPVLDETDNCNWIGGEKNVNHASDPDYDAIAILYSSGTTSSSKGVVIGYEQEFNALDRLLEVVGTPDIRYLMLFPNSHVSGFTDFLVLLLRGGQLATMEEASAAQILRGFQLYRPNTFGMVPKVWETFKNKIEDGIRDKGEKKAKSIFRLISFCGLVREKTGLNLGRKIFSNINEQVFGGRLIQIHSGGGKSNPNVMKFFWNLGYDTYDFYASTEANIPILVTDGKRFMSSVGNINSNPKASIRIADPDKDGVGEIQVKSNTLMKGYFRNPELSQEAFDDGYFRTGDYGQIINNELYITGRIKESIFLRNGEKASPEDIESCMQEILDKEIDFAVTGIECEDGYEDIVLFVVGKSGEFDKELKKANEGLSVNNRFRRIVYLDSIPKTSVGKVKRYQLKTIYSELSNEQLVKPASISSRSKNNDNLANASSEKGVLYQIISKHVEKAIESGDRLIDDLNLDSLSIFEICSEIDEKFGIDLSTQITAETTVIDIEDALNQKHQKKVTNIKKYDVSDYPEKKTRIDFGMIRVISILSRIFWKTDVKGIDNIPKDKRYIICANHESHLDSMWIIGALLSKGIDIRKECCCLGAEYVMLDKHLKRGFRAMGGIPVDRTGNPYVALMRACEYINDNQSCIFMIHPEGTRTRNGQMGEFKLGAAEIAKKTGLQLLPVCINGAWEIYPYDRKCPNLFSGRNLTINIGKPIIELNESPQKLTEELQRRIVEMKH